MIWGTKTPFKYKGAQHKVNEVANYFIALAKDSNVSLSNMQLQKLVYIAFGYYAAILNEPLFEDEIQAWNYGPVIPNLYHLLKKYGAGEVTDFVDASTTITADDPASKIIEGVWNTYIKYDGIQLSKLTHEEGTPWSNVWNKDQRNATIPLAVIRQHYEHLSRD